MDENTPSSLPAWVKEVTNESQPTLEPPRSEQAFFSFTKDSWWQATVGGQVKVSCRSYDELIEIATARGWVTPGKSAKELGMKKHVY